MFTTASWITYLMGALAFGASIYALVPLTPGRGRHHAWGADVMFLGWCACWAIDATLTGRDAMASYATVNLAATILLFHPLVLRPSVWASLCIGFNALAVLAFIRYMADASMFLETYIFVVNLSFVGSVLSIIAAITVSRNKWGEGIDLFFSRICYKRWTFSGSDFPRIYE